MLRRIVCATVRRGFAPNFKRHCLSRIARGGIIHRRGLRVTVQASDDKVDHDPVEQHHARTNDGQDRGPQALVFAAPTRVYQQREYNKSVQRKNFFGVPTPRASPTVIGPNGAHGKASPQQYK